MPFFPLISRAGLLACAALLCAGAEAAEPPVPPPQKTAAEPQKTEAPLSFDEARTRLHGTADRLRIGDAQIAHDRMLLMFPTGSLLSQYVRQDPLNLFTPVVSRLQQFQFDLKYELYDGYVLTPDRRRAIVTMRTPYGSNETDNNARLIEMLMEAASATQTALPAVEIHLSGAPVIAVTNSRQIKSDSLWAISIAVVLILARFARYGRCCSSE